MGRAFVSTYDESWGGVGRTVKWHSPNQMAQVNAVSIVLFKITFRAETSYCLCLEGFCQKHSLQPRKKLIFLEQQNLQQLDDPMGAA